MSPSEAFTHIEAPSKHWPGGEVATCACPHCGHVDEHQIASVRECGLRVRDGECSACHEEYVVTARNGAVVAEKLLCDSQSYLIQHHYDIGDQGVTVTAPVGFDARQAAIYLQFRAERWFGDEKIVTNLGIASALVTFYGCKHSPRNRRGEIIDMHNDREAMCPDAAALMADRALHREGLRAFLRVHIRGCVHARDEPGGEHEDK